MSRKDNAFCEIFGTFLLASDIRDNGLYNGSLFGVVRVRCSGQYAIFGDLLT